MMKMPQSTEVGYKVLESNSSEVLKFVLTTSHVEKEDDDDHAKSERAICNNESDFEILDNENDDHEQMIDFNEMFHAGYKRDAEHR